MIQLTRTPCPTELTQTVKDALTLEYTTTGKSVWKQKYIEKALLTMSNDKCCYCECRVGEESKYMEVEHFLPKSHRPDLVVDWNNLLPSCKRCNGSKSNHNTETEPIIDPSAQNPKEHLLFRAFRLRPKTPLGEMTIDVLKLNHRERVVNKRFEVGQKIIEIIEALREETEEYIANKSTKKRNKILTKLDNIMLEALPKAIYSATVATVLFELCTEDYNTIKTILQNENLWGEDFQNMENVIQQIKLDLR